MENERKPQDKTQNELEDSVKDAEEVQDELSDEQLDKVAGGFSVSDFVKALGDALSNTARNG